jgi:hypothetical protein
MSSSETPPSPSREASGTSSTCPPTKEWPVSSKVAIRVQDQYRVVHQSVRAVGEADRAKEHDALICIDPGIKNLGMAIFIRGADSETDYRLECGFELELENFQTHELAPYVLGAIIRFFSPYNTAYRKQSPLIARRFKRFLVAVEAPGGDANGQNQLLRQFIHSLKACSELNRPNRAETLFDFLDVGPAGVNKFFKIPSGLSYTKRKSLKAKLVGESLGLSIPRHDVSDAIGIGAYVLAKGRANLIKLPIPFDFAQQIFQPIPEPEPEKEPEPVVVPEEPEVIVLEPTPVLIDLTKEDRNPLDVCPECNVYADDCKCVFCAKCRIIASACDCLEEEDKPVVMKGREVEWLSDLDDPEPHIHKEGVCLCTGDLDDHPEY